jgi:S1-C subfamily serine protease
MAREVLDQLIKSGKVRRGHLGIVVQPVTEEIASSLGLSSARGVVVSQVQPRSAAERAGLKQADVILALNGNAVSDPNSFRNDIAATPPGQTVTLRIWRQGNEQELRPTLGEFTSEERRARSSENGSSGQRDNNDGRLGLSVQPLTPSLAQELGLRSDTQGLVVMEVDPSGPAADAGIRRGDVIEQVNQQPVRSVADLRSAIDRSGNKPLLLLVTQRGTTVFVTVRPR